MAACGVMLNRGHPISSSSSRLGQGHPAKLLQCTRRTTTKTKTKLLFSKSSDPIPEYKENNKARSFSSPEDLRYMLKLGAGSVVGAAAIKYGSVLFPAITRPNLTEALILISTPMLLSVLLLIRQSYAEEQSKDPS